MKHLKNIEALSNAIKEIDMNGLRVESAMVELKVDRETYAEIEDEFKNSFPHTYKIDSIKLGVEFNGISFIILHPRF